MISSKHKGSSSHREDELQQITKTDDQESEASLPSSTSGESSKVEKTSSILNEFHPPLTRTKQKWSISEVLLFSFFLVLMFVVCWNGYHLNLLKLGLSWLNPQGSSCEQQEMYLCLSPRRLIYGTLSNLSVQSLVQMVLFPIFLSPLVFPNLMSLVIGVLLLLVCCSKRSFFSLLKTLFAVQWSVFAVRAVLSFVLFRVFGWMESMLWAYDARHFIACNYGVTSFVMFEIVQSISRVSDDTVRNQSSRNLIFRVILLLCACFVIHFTAHLPFNEMIPFRYDTDLRKHLLSYTSRYSDYMIDHTIGCILGFLFA
ncbi:hypothetical protein FDP41_000412 [Naegleria fowleri]|uniref:Uncharacterized protein n=1 Tax=Naegleria fowleri TaxID=5763 RepID=A0A6A5C262_NAEFO|nr:uncharacterized protein FDP41_000412 [Naegleria fowleri]KAF0984513.1 hypothetical protein FDP41_000412 [Naegleria fowleri]CAG4711553.1 unnamed protein product [Naegleria fowleri]